MLRFAISLIKDMHIGDLRVAIINYILSKQLNEKLLIIIEDIDKQKSIEGKNKENLEILNLFSIEYASIMYQSENLKYYQKLAMQLMSQKKAFACFCGEEKLEELRKEAEKKGSPFIYDGFCETLLNETILNCNAPFTVRIKKPENSIRFTDSLKGNFKSSCMDSFIILKQDKTPIENYACAVDDMLYDISTVVKDEKYFSNTPKQIHIRKQLNYEKEVNYVHLPTIINEETYSVKWLIDEGFLPSAIANYLVLIGNNTPTEIFSLEEAIEWFDIKNIPKDKTKFDIDKLKLINKKHLNAIDELRFSKILGFADTDIGKLGKLYLKEVSTIKEIKSKIDLIFAPKSTCEGYEEQFVKLRFCIQDAPYFEALDELKVYLSEKTGLKDENLLKPLRYILTGRDTGPSISDIYVLIKNYLGEIVK